MDTWRSRIEKRSLGREKSREPTIFPRAEDSVPQREALKIPGGATKMDPQ